MAGRTGGLGIVIGDVANVAGAADVAGGAADVTGGAAGGLDAGADEATGVPLPPQAVSATNRIQMKIVVSLVPRLNAVFFNAILLKCIFQNSQWTCMLVL